jgi:C1A family cysteine protease
MARVKALVLAAAGLSTAALGAGASADQVRDFDVAAMRAYGEKTGATYEVKDNWVTDYLSKGGDRAHITGLKHPSQFGESMKNARFINLQPKSDLPAAFDWRDQVEGGMQPIRNQGNCGSCWAFSITAVVESLYRIAHPEMESINLGEQALVDCSPYDCSGGYFDAFDYVQRPGLPTEASYPYRARNQNCNRNAPAAQSIVNWAYIGDGNTSPTTEQMKTAIMQYGPISVDVNASFSSYSSGVFNSCNTAETDHMVTIEGWNDAGQYWIMRNSWGSDWGEDGYMRIKYTDSRGRKCNGIGRVAAFAVLDGAGL